MSRLPILVAAIFLLAAPASAQNAVPTWTEDFWDRPAKWGGPVRYAVLDMPGWQTLKVGCARNRIERVTIVFPRVNDVLAPLADNPRVRYAFDNEELQPVDWPLFEKGSIEVPRGTSSARITRRIAKADRFVVQATKEDGDWLTAEFDLLDSETVVPKMLAACEIR